MDMEAVIGLPRDGYEVEIKADIFGVEGEVRLAKLGFPIARLEYTTYHGPRFVVLGRDHKTPEEVRDLAVGINFLANVMRLYPKCCPASVKVALPREEDGRADIWEVKAHA